jgi:integrase
LTDDELVRLVRAARERPLLEAATVRTGPRRGKSVGNVRPEVRSRLERLGWERALMYKTMVWTGLRRGELAALRVRDLTLNGPRPCLTMPGSATKNREGANLPLRDDLVRELTEWLAATGKADADRVFKVPVELVKILKRDLAHAGIAYRDRHGRTVDVHALRHTTATLLSRAKVSPRVAQGFMRHADIKLTMQTYTDAQMLDETEALTALPDLPLKTDGGSPSK